MRNRLLILIFIFSLPLLVISEEVDLSKSSSTEKTVDTSIKKSEVVKDNNRNSIVPKVENKDSTSNVLNEVKSVNVESSVEDKTVEKPTSASIKDESVDKKTDEPGKKLTLEEELLLIGQDDFIVKDEVSKPVEPSVSEVKRADSTIITDSAVSKTALAHSNDTTSLVKVDSSIITDKIQSQPLEITIGEVESINSIDFKKNVKDYRSPQKAMFMSLVLPGSGQVYGKRLWETALFATIEAATITGAIIFNKKGDDQKTAAHSYGDTNFDESRMGSFFQDLQNHGYVYYDSTGIETNQIDSAIFMGNFLTDDSSNAYDKFMEAHSSDRFSSDYGVGTIWGAQGWDDATKYGSSYEVFYDTSTYALDPISELHLLDANGKSFFGSSVKQDKYNSMIDKSKEYYRYRGVFVAGIIVNHVASAIDAFFTAYRYNKKLLQAEKEEPVKESMLENISIDNRMFVTADRDLKLQVGLQWRF